MKLGRNEIARRVPHHGSMCLLDEVVASDEDSITCRASSHRDAANPLRSAGMLSAIMGVEYAAQAVAIHGALSDPALPKNGYLAAIRDVACAVERLDTEAQDLVVSATRLAAEGGRLLYDFRVEGGGRELIKGRLSVVRVDDPGPGHGR